MLLITPALQRGQFHRRFRMILWKEWTVHCCCAPKDGACWKVCGEPGKYWKVLVKEACMRPARSPWLRGAAEFISSFSRVENSKNSHLLCLGEFFPGAKLLLSSVEANFHFGLHTQTQNCTRALVMASPGCFQERCKNLQQALVGWLVLRNFLKLLLDVGALHQPRGLIIVLPKTTQWKLNSGTRCRDSCTDFMKDPPSFTISVQGFCPA